MNSKKRRERKQIITLAVSMAVIILLVVIYFIVRNAVNGGEGNDTDDKLGEIGELGSFTVVDEDYQKITKLSYKYNNETLNLHIEDGRWQLDGDKNFPVDQEKLVYMSQAISDYGGIQRFEYDEKNTSLYGFDDPKFDISATYIGEDGGEDRTRRFMIGNENKVTGYYYFYEDGGKYVYMVTDSIFKYFMYVKMDLFYGTKMPFPDVDDIIELEASFNDVSYKFNADQDTDIDIKDENSTLKRIMDSMPTSSQLSYPMVAEYGVDEPGLEKYGLKEPELTVRLKYKEYKSVSASDGGSSAQMAKEMEFVMQFGDFVTEGEGENAKTYVYACAKDTGIVYKIDAESYNGIYSAVKDSTAG